MSKTKKIIIWVVVIGVLVGVGFYANNFIKAKKEKIKLGLSSSKFPYGDYTEQELGKMYPQIKYKDVATRTTPEETYAKFRQALKDNNLDMAIAQLAEEGTRYEENVKSTREVYSAGDFLQGYSRYPEKIIQESMYDNIASYYFVYNEDGRILRDYIGFQKNIEGDWKISDF